MASDVDICNLALANIGDRATVISIDPPDNTPQAAHCSRFYPIARDELLSMHAWDFTKKRVALTPFANESVPTWQYAYAVPSDMNNALAVLTPDAADDYSVDIPIPYSFLGSMDIGRGMYTPQPFAIETGSLNQMVLRTSVENAVLVYTFKQVNPQLFSPLFVSCLSWLLAAKLAGAIWKGDGGQKATQQAMATFQQYFAKASSNDANNRYIRPSQRVDWIANR